MEEMESLPSIISRQLKSLMDQSDLTIEGLSEAAGLTTHTITKILKAKTRISPLTLEKITGLFGITASKLMSAERIDLSNRHLPEALENFYDSYEANPKYFQSRAKENVVAHFMKTVLVNDPYLNEGRRVRDIAEYIHTNPAYQKDFNPKVIAKVLDRMTKAGNIRKEDKTGKRSVYYYSRTIIE